MTTHQLTCLSSPADGICSGSVILQAGGERGPKVTSPLQCPPRILRCFTLLQHTILRPHAAWAHFALALTLSWTAVLVQRSRGLREACAGAQASPQPKPEGCFCDSAGTSNNGTYLFFSCLLLAGSTTLLFVKTSKTRSSQHLHSMSIMAMPIFCGLTKHTLVSDRVEWQG